MGLPTGEEEDWCFRYLAEKISKHKPFNIVVPPARFLQEDSPWSRWDSWMSQIFRGKPKNYNVAIVGSEFSGRQTILDLLKIAIWDGVALGPALSFHAESPLNGAITLPGGKTGKIVVFDPKVSTEPPKGNVGVSGLSSARQSFSQFLHAYSVIVLAKHKMKCKAKKAGKLSKI